MIRTTTVGSWPIPPRLKPELTRYYRGETDDQEAHDILQQAAGIAMREQRDCGIDQIMGGEVFAPDFVHHVPPRLSGLRCVKRRDHRSGYEGVASYEIVGEIVAPRGTGHALAFRREKAIEPLLDKAAVPSPLTMTIPFFTDPRCDEQIENLAAVVAAEIEDMARAGAAEVQLDAPAEAVAMILGLRPVDEILHWLLKPLRGLREVRRTIHFCLGDMGKRPFTEEQNLHSLMPLIGRLEGHVDRIHLECSYASQWAEHELLGEIPETIEVIAGIADVKREPETTEELLARIAELAKTLPPDRLLVSSSCGCGRCTPDDAKRLMGNLVEAAHLV